MPTHLNRVHGGPQQRDGDGERCKRTNTEFNQTILLCGIEGRRGNDQPDVLGDLLSGDSFLLMNRVGKRGWSYGLMSMMLRLCDSMELWVESTNSKFALGFELHELVTFI